MIGPLPKALGVATLDELKRCMETLESEEHRVRRQVISWKRFHPAALAPLGARRVWLEEAMRRAGARRRT